MLENILWGLGVVLAAFLIPLVVYIVVKTAGNLARERVPTTRIDANRALESAVQKGLDELRNTQGMQQTQVADLAHGVQLMRQEWDDFYDKARRSEDRTRKAIKAASDRAGDDEDTTETDQMLLALMQQKDDQGVSLQEDLFERADRLRPRGQ